MQLHCAVGTLRLWSADDEKVGPWSTVVRSLAHADSFTWLDGTEPHGTLPQLRGNAWLGPEASKAFIAGDSPRVRITKKSVLTDVQSPNVVGLLPGSDPRLRNEYVVFTAHLDHLGIGDPVNGDTIGDLSTMAQSTTHPESPHCSRSHAPSPRCPSVRGAPSSSLPSPRKSPGSSDRIISFTIRPCRSNPSWPT